MTLIIANFKIMAAKRRENIEVRLLIITHLSRDCGMVKVPSMGARLIWATVA